MGLDVSTYVVFGKLVDRQVLTQKVQVRGCSHSIVQGQNFCSICGKPAWETKEEKILDGMDPGSLTYFYPYYESPEAVIGFRLKESGSHRSSNPGFLEVTQPDDDMLIQLREFFLEHNLPFEDKDLKTYAFSYFSY